MASLDRMLKSRDTNLPTNVVKAMVFPVAMYRCESAKELMPLNCDAGEDSRVFWMAKRLNQSILKEINPKYSFEGL